MPMASDARPPTAPQGRVLRVLGALAIIAVFTRIGCEEGRRPLTPRSQRGFIAFVGASRNDPLWGVLRATAERYQAGLGGFEVRTAVPDILSPNAQINLLREMHSAEMRGLCIQPADAAIMKDILEDLRIEGVPVVTMLTRIEAENPFVHAGLDELAIGRAMADAIFRALEGKGTIALLYDRGSTSRHADRYLGFKERIVQLPGVAVLRELDCQGNDFVAERLVRDYMERFPRLNGWVSIDNWPLRNIPSTERLLPRDCKMVTYGPFPQYWPRISDGTCHAIVGARYERVAENALRMCVTAARGEVLLLTDYLAPPVTITQRNLTRFKLSWLR